MFEKRAFARTFKLGHYHFAPFYNQICAGVPRSKLAGY